MSKITFILGGARSGKSAFALKTAKYSVGKIAFLATCEAKDAEMKKRINLHKKNRPAHWKTFEEPNLDPSSLKKLAAKFDTVIIDCLTLLVSNLMLTGMNSKTIENKFKEIMRIINKGKAKVIIVSNEVGLGIVPENKLARDFRDIAGRVNQLVAKESEEVFFLISGIPWRIK